MTLRALAILMLLLVAVPGARAEPVYVFAAASLKTALDAIAPGWHAAGGADLRLVYGGSSALARQIEAGAPADVFISANVAWMDHLDAAGLIEMTSRTEILGNRLVLIGAPDTPPTEIAALPEALAEERLAMALVDAVPAGIYGKAALVSLGIWDSLAARVAQTDNVRAALALVALGEAAYGIVYASDAQAEARVDLLATFPADSHPPIRYPAAVLHDSKADSAAAYLQYLRTPQAGAIFRDQGFVLP